MIGITDAAVPRKMEISIAARHLALPCRTSKCRTIGIVIIAIITFWAAVLRRIRYTSLPIQMEPFNTGGRNTYAIFALGCCSIWDISRLTFLPTLATMMHIHQGIFAPFLAHALIAWTIVHTLTA